MTDPNINVGLVTKDAPASLTSLYYLKNILLNLGGAAATALQTLVGSLTETAPATDTASSGLNGRLQRIAQRLTTIINDTNPNQVYVSNSFTNITTATTTVVKSGAGTLARIQVNAAGAANNVTIYDNTAASGTLIGTHTAITLRELNYDLAFGTGLTIVTSAACDLTVVYR